MSKATSKNNTTSLTDGPVTGKTMSKTITQKLLKCTINGQQVEVLEGTSVIEAIKNQEQDIAHYCWHPGLSVAGVCRLCMVDIEGQPKLQIACNTKVQEGMVVSNQTKKVQEAVRWGLEFHLINHPLDCPICDQAGECSLQNQYMKFGTYDPTMAKPKVKKRKVVDLGSKIVLDTERCILCSRCVRFTDEVTKTHELGIFNRGDRSEIGVFKDKPLKNDYALNTVDICPVGALTSKDFRFKQRVWYTKTASSICTGCSTGCNTDVDYNEEGVWRVRPRYNKDINGYWMCDKGRGLYQNLNRKARMQQAFKAQDNKWNPLSSKDLIQSAKQEFLFKNNIAIVLTGQYNNQEYQSLKNHFSKATYYHWMNKEQELNDFDGLLLRGDKNPNTAGLKNIFPDIKSWGDFETDCNDYDWVLVLGPENTNFYTDIEQKSLVFSKSKKMLWLSTQFNSFLESKDHFYQIPMKSVFEKTGDYTNYKGITQKTKAVQTLVPQALSLEEFIQLLNKQTLDLQSSQPYFKHNQFLDKKEKLW